MVQLQNKLSDFFEPLCNDFIFLRLGPWGKYISFFVLFSSFIAYGDSTFRQETPCGVEAGI